MTKSLSLLGSVCAVLLLGCLGPGEEGLAGMRNQDLTQAVCEGLSEQACLTTAGCELVYPACPAVLCDPDLGDCPVCDTTPRCQTATPPTPPSPPADPCTGLLEAACQATPGCTAEYAERCAVCIPDVTGSCPPCEATYLGCSINTTPVSHCQGLDERSCNQASGCVGIYSGICPPCPDTAMCSPCDPNSFSFSHCADDVSFCDPGPIPGGENGGGYETVDAGTPRLP